jgi:hypothetical protein
VDTWFVDDSRQRQPTRPGMGDLVAVGGIKVLEDQLAPFQQAIERVCGDFGFPEGQEFKWSPGKELWMRDKLVGDRRRAFYFEVFTIARVHQVKGIFVLADAGAASATGAAKAEHDVVTMLLERIQHDTAYTSRAQILADAPGGGNAQADEFIIRNLGVIRNGTNAVARLDRLTFVQTIRSHHSRGLQVADVFTSCLCAYVAGEEDWTLPVVQLILPILRRELDRVGGCGVKLHPDYRYANLYFWLFGDTHLWKSNCGNPLPLTSRPYHVDRRTP